MRRTIGVTLAVVCGVLLLGGAGLAVKVLSRAPLAAVPSTTHATIGREACIECHAPIADEWRGSYHYQSITGPYWTEAKELGYLALFDRVRKPCVNCHAPANVLDLAEPAASGSAAPDGDLGVECTPNLLRDPKGIIPAARADDPELGVDCTACHVSARGISGTGLRPTGTHETLPDPRFQDPLLTSSALCRTCHLAKVEAWKKTRLAADGVSCLDCHMPRVQAPSVVDGAQRSRRSHGFPADKDDDMLRRAVNATLQVSAAGEARLRLVNDRVGHHFPSGGNWLSVHLTARDDSGNVMREHKQAFGRNEALVLDFWPFNADTRIPFGEEREILFALPDGHGSVKAVIRYHDWMRTRRTVLVLSRDY